MQHKLMSSVFVTADLLRVHTDE